MVLRRSRDGPRGYDARVRVALVVLVGVAACGRIQFDPLADAATAGGDGSVPAPDAPPPMVCSTTGLTCTDGGFMKCGDACFAYCNDTMPQSSAIDRCAAWSGALASIASTAEQTCVLGLLTNDAWIGLVQDVGAGDVDLGWRWLDGTVAPITGWFSGEPEDGGAPEDGAEQCALQGGGGWLDAVCADNKPLICKRPAL